MAMATIFGTGEALPREELLLTESWYQIHIISGSLLTIPAVGWGKFMWIPKQDTRSMVS